MCFTEDRADFQSDEFPCFAMLDDFGIDQLVGDAFYRSGFSALLSRNLHACNPGSDSTTYPG